MHTNGRIRVKYVNWLARVINTRLQPFQIFLTFLLRALVIRKSMPPQGRKPHERKLIRARIPTEWVVRREHQKVGGAVWQAHSNLATDQSLPDPHHSSCFLCRSIILARHPNTCPSGRQECERCDKPPHPRNIDGSLAQPGAKRETCRYSCDKG